MKEKEIKELYAISWQLRRKSIEMIYNAGTGHGAPSLSMADMITALYFKIMQLDPKQPQWVDRDRFVLSKGHACPIYYAALARRGYFPEEELMTYRALNSRLQGHPDMRKCPGVDMTTGSLGNGFSAAVGMAISAKKDQRQNHVYCITGDGELQEGIVWEAAMFAGNHALDNLIVFVDYNGLQSGGSVKEIQDLESLAEKFESFRWNVEEIDGHDVEAICEAAGRAQERKNGRPTVIIAKTIKGKGVSYMENNYLWHMKAPNAEQYQQALEEIDREAKKYA